MYLRAPQQSNTYISWWGTKYLFAFTLVKGKGCQVSFKANSLVQLLLKISAKINKLVHFIAIKMEHVLMENVYVLDR